MITQNTAGKIWHCYSEIIKSKKLLTDMKEAYEKTETLDLKDTWGERKQLQLGVPSASDSTRLFGVPVDLSVKIIEAHIENQEKKLKELMAVATVELKG